MQVTRVLHCSCSCSVNLVSCNLGLSAEIPSLPLLPCYLDALSSHLGLKVQLARLENCNPCRCSPGILMQCSHFSHLGLSAPGILRPTCALLVHCIKIPVQCSAAIWNIWVSVQLAGLGIPGTAAFWPQP